MKLFFLFICLQLCLILTAHSQNLSGIITDAETNQPLEAVMISVLKENKMIDYTLTDAKGRYTLPWNYKGNLQVSFSLLGYKKELHAISQAGTLNLPLKSEAIVLKEVLIRAGRISTRKDTVRYDLSRFASEKDVHIKDVLKKLPGVDVDENGEVKYKGKPIDHYFVEGMDISGGRYNQINNNLSAKAVKTAEIMENYQSVKALKGKINSDEVALNLKLDPKARDQWMLNASLGGGWADTSGKANQDEVLWEGALNALQLGVGNQSVYNYKTNNNGTDLSQEQKQFIRHQRPPEVETFLSQPAISAPLDKKRLLFNRTHTLNGNRMYKWNEERTLRLQAGYTNDLIRQQRSNSQTYFQPHDTLQIDETYQLRLESNAANAELTYEDNNSRNYLINRLSINGEINKGFSQELGQTIKTSQLTADNFLNCILNRDKHTWELNSTLRYAYLPSALLLTDTKGRVRQNNFYMDNKASYLRKYNGFTQQYTTGVQADINSIDYQTTEEQTFRAPSYSIYLSPLLRLERGKLRTTLSLPLKFKRYTSLQRSLLLFNPSLSFRYQPNYRWLFSAYGSYNRSTGSFTDFCPLDIQTDYRMYSNGNNLLPLQGTQSYSLYGEYKNTANEFFITLQLGYNRTQHHTLVEQTVTENTIRYTRRDLPNNTDNCSLNLTFSKGFYDWRMKTSLNLLVGRNKGKQLTGITSTAGNHESLLQSYRYDYLKAEPKIIWLPLPALEVEYHGTIGYGGSKIGSDTELTPLLDMIHRLHLTYSIGRVDLRLSGEYYRNDLGTGTHLNTLFADASIAYKKGKWRFDASLNNLFNKKEYAYTLYSATQVYTSRLNIRPREVMAKVSYQF